MLGGALRSAWILLFSRCFHHLQLQAASVSSQPVLPRGAATSKCPGKDTRRGWEGHTEGIGRTHGEDGKDTRRDDHTGALPRSSLPALSHFQLCSDQPWPDPLPSCSQTPPLTSALSCPLSPGAADRTGAVSVHWDLRGFPKGEETTPTPLLWGCLDPVGERDPGRGRLETSLPLQKKICSV